jgi:primosomal protein N' (replication factor Y) (superfamily II helicase)
MSAPESTVRTDAFPPARPNTAQPSFADVIVPRHLRRTFTYSIPASLRSQIYIGSLVRVPLGPSTVPGIVVRILSEGPSLPSTTRTTPIRLRDILAVVNEPADAAIPPDILELSRQVSDYYLAPWGQCLRLILPALPGMRKTSRSRRTSQVRQTPTAAGHSTGALQLLPPAAPPWWSRFQDALTAHRHETFLVEDVLSRRWATLLHAAEIALERNETVLIISPEIRRAAALAALGLNRWPDRVAQIHSGLPPAVREREWRRIQTGVADIVVGTRSAIFAPLRAPGLICVDDEDDPSLKEEQEPHYHAREVAAMRARQHGTVLLLGTAHPAVETRYQVGAQPILTPAVRAAVHLVDLRQTPTHTLLSEPMLDGIRATLEAKTGAILFANQKGFAAALHCRDCGVSPRCTHCSVSLTLYKRANRMACRYCGATEPIPEICPACRSSRIEPVGTGTERLEEELRRLFPGARIGRLDRDTARTPEQATRLRNGIAEGQLDLLIGTQLLFQDMPTQPVGFVGIPYADAGLHRPDFRSAERTYHALRDAVGLARTDGLAVLQTILPDHHAIASVAAGDPTRFYEQELAFRRALGYPPFAHLISLCVSGKTDAAVRTAAERWAAAVKEYGKKNPGTVTVLGPIPASVEQVRGRHRRQILVKSADGDAARQSVRATLEKIEAGKEHRGLKFDVTVDPIELG